jgi:putative membrane protein
MIDVPVLSYINQKNRCEPMTIAWVSIFIAVLIWSGIHPKDHFTWVMEVAPAIAAVVILTATRKRFPLTNLSYILILIHSIILMVGGHYTYAEVPLFDWIRDFLHQARNNYDKVGHFAQGFIPAIIAREILIRREVVQRRGWLAFIVVSICLAISACYEFIEWWTAELVGEGAEAFLGTQGYAWDTQSDMLFAFIGAATALALLGRLHDRQIDALRKRNNGKGNA